MFKTKRESKYYFISGTFGPLWAVRPDDRLHLVSNVQHGVQLPDASHEQLPQRCDDAAGWQKIVREADQQFPPAALCGLRYRLPPLHPPVLSHHAYHPEDLLQSLGEPHIGKLAREITGVESTAGNAGQVSSIQWSQSGIGVRGQRTLVVGSGQQRVRCGRKWSNP